MSKGICAITGTTGFLGHHIANKMKESGWSIIKLQRGESGHINNRDTIVKYSLGKTLDPKVLDNVDVLIHCAHDFSCNNWEKMERTNIEGTKLLFDTAKKAKVGLIVLISSMHAFEGCRTIYGRAKLACEKYALDYGGIVIRPGTIYGEKDDKLFGGVGGNTLQSFENLFRISPVIPILYSKIPSVYTSHIQDLCTIIEEAVSKNEVVDKPICAVNKVPMTIKQFMVKIKERQSRKKVLFIPVPWRIPWLFFLFLEKLNIKLSFRSDSILTFFDQNPEPDFSILEHLKTRIRPF